MDKFTYLVEDNGKTIIIKDGSTTIPSRAFYENNVVEKIVIPDSVTTIERCSFGFCTSLKEVILPERLKEIGVEAFIRCTSLVNVKIPGSVQAIGPSAFSNCSSLKEVILPEGLKEIDKYVFARCTNLKNVKIPDSVQAIGLCTFFKCLSLENIKLPENLKEIGERAFESCTSLKKMEIPNSVDFIGEYSFSSCTEVEEVILPEGLECISNSVFNNCTDLDKIKIPDSVKKVGHGAFYKCSSLEEVILPDGLVRIENFGFSDCTSLKRMEIPNSAQSVGYSAFHGCKSLKEVILPEELKSINTTTFKGCSDLIKVNLPNSLEIISGGAFSGCESLKEVILPEGLVTIEKFSFNNCTSLEKMEIPDSAQSIGWGAFDGCKNLKTITIKYKEYEELKNLLVNSENWLNNIENYQYIELVGPNLNIKQKINIMFLLKNNFSSFRTSNVKNEKVVDYTENKLNDDTELELLRGKIKKISNGLPDEIKNKIKSIEDDFLKGYSDRYNELRPNFDDFQGSINLKFDEDVESLNVTLISNLKFMLATLSSMENTMKFLEELNAYKKLLHEGTNELSEGADTKDIINNIVYISGKLGDRASEHLSELSKYIDEAIKSGSLEIENAFKNDPKLPVIDYTTKFKLNVSKLYDELKNKFETIKVYMEILDSLNAKETSYQGGDDLTCRVGSVKYIIANKIDRKKIKEEAEEKLNEFIKKYTDIINNILNNETLLKTTNPREIKTDFLKEFGLIIENLNNYVENIEYETMKKNRLLDELNEAKNIVEKSKMVDENSVSGDIKKYVVEINNRWVKDSTIKKSERKKIQNKLLEEVNKSLEIMDKSREELISYIEEERKCFIDKWLDILPESDSKLINSLKKSIEKSSEVYGEENLELYDWNNLALKIIFGHIAYADLYTMSFLKANNNHAAASLKKRHSRK